MGSILGSLRRTGLTRSSQTWGRMPVGSYTHRRVVWRFAYSIGPRELSALLRPSLHRGRGACGMAPVSPQKRGPRTRPPPTAGARRGPSGLALARSANMAEI